MREAAGIHDCAHVSPSDVRMLLDMNAAWRAHTHQQITSALYAIQACKNALEDAQALIAYCPKRSGELESCIDEACSSASVLNDLAQSLARRSKAYATRSSDA